MTGTELKNAERLISTEDIVKMGDELLNKLRPGFDAISMYPPTEGVEPILSVHRAQMYIGSMINLFRRAYYLGATGDELTRITMHRKVLEKAFSDKLNYRQSEIDNGIKDLSNKYDMYEFLKMDFPIIEKVAKNIASY